MNENKIISNYLDSQIRCINEIKQNNSSIIKKIFHTLIKAKKNDLKKFTENQIEEYSKL